MIAELEPAEAPAVSAAELAAHLRLPEGFGPDAAAEAGLEGYARAASAAVEGLTGLALIRRRFRWTVGRWRCRMRVRAPIGPKVAVEALRTVAADGAAVEGDAAVMAVIFDGPRAWLTGANGRDLPAVPRGGTVEIDLAAGFGAAAEVPADLRQAVLLLAAHWHEQRHVSADPAGEAPFGVRAICARWREVRL